MTYMQVVYSSKLGRDNDHPACFLRLFKAPLATNWTLSHILNVSHISLIRVICI